MSVTWTAEQGVEVRPTAGAKGLILWQAADALSRAVMREEWPRAKSLAVELTPLVPEADLRCRPMCVGSMHYQNAPGDVRAALDAYNDAVWRLKGVPRPRYTPPPALDRHDSGDVRRPPSTSNTADVARPPEASAPAPEPRPNSPADVGGHRDEGGWTGAGDRPGPQEIPVARGEACMGGQEWLGGTIAAVCGNGRHRFVTLTDGRKFVIGKRNTVARQWPWPGCEQEGFAEWIGHK